MHKYMMEHPEFLTKDNEEGVKRVYEGVHNYGNLMNAITFDIYYCYTSMMLCNYLTAFLMESSSILYETERKCNLTQVGDVLDDKNYGIGMRKGERTHVNIQKKEALSTHFSNLFLYRIQISSPNERRNVAYTRVRYSG